MTTPPDTLGRLIPGEIWTASKVRRVLHWQEHVWRRARLANFPTIRFGRGVFVDTNAAISWFRGLPDDANDNNGATSPPEHRP